MTFETEEGFHWKHRSINDNNFITIMPKQDNYSREIQIYAEVLDLKEQIEHNPNMSLLCERYLSPSLSEDISFELYGDVIASGNDCYLNIRENDIIMDIMYANADIQKSDFEADKMILKCTNDKDITASIYLQDNDYNRKEVCLSEELTKDLVDLANRYCVNQKGMSLNELLYRKNNVLDKIDRKMSFEYEID